MYQKIQVTGKKKIKVFQEPPKDRQCMTEQLKVINDVEKCYKDTLTLIQTSILSPFQSTFSNALSTWIHDFEQSAGLLGDHYLLDRDLVGTYHLYNAVDSVLIKCNAALNDFVEETVSKLAGPHLEKNHKLVDKVGRYWDKYKSALLEVLVKKQVDLALDRLQAYARNYVRRVALQSLIFVESFLQDCIVQPSLNRHAALCMQSHNTADSQFHAANYKKCYDNRWSELERLEMGHYHENNYIDLLRQDMIRYHMFRIQKCDTPNPPVSETPHRDYVASTPEQLGLRLKQFGVEDELRERIRHLKMEVQDIEEEVMEDVQVEQMVGEVQVEQMVDDDKDEAQIMVDDDKDEVPVVVEVEQMVNKPARKAQLNIQFERREPSNFSIVGIDQSHGENIYTHTYIGIDFSKSSFHLSHLLQMFLNSSLLCTYFYVVDRGDSFQRGDFIMYINNDKVSALKKVRTGY